MFQNIDWFEVCLIAFLVALALLVIVIAILGAFGVIHFDASGPRQPVIVCQKIGSTNICTSY